MSQEESSGLKQDEEKYIQERYWQVFHLHQESIRNGLSFLLFINSGGAIAVAGFLGASEFEFQTDDPVRALAFYVIGIVLAGVILYLKYCQTHSIFEGWREDSQTARQDPKSYKTLLEQDNARSRNRWYWKWLAIGSFICFGIGSFFAFQSLFAIVGKDVPCPIEESTPAIERNDASMADVSRKETVIKEENPSALLDTNQDETHSQSSNNATEKEIKK